MTGISSVRCGTVAVFSALLAACAPAYRLTPPAPLLTWNPPPVPRPERPPVPDVPPSYVVLLPDADGKTGEVTMSTPLGRQTLNRPKQAADLQGGASAFSVTDAQLKRDFGEVMTARPVLPERYRLFFLSRSTQLTPESVPVLNTILKRAQQFTALEVVVVGHTDTRGDPEDNRVLGLKRARSFAEQLVAKGLSAQGIEIASDGEYQPLIATGDNVAEPRNRRVEVTLR